MFPLLFGRLGVTVVDFAVTGSNVLLSIFITIETVINITEVCLGKEYAHFGVQHDDAQYYLWVNILEPGIIALEQCMHRSRCTFSHVSIL